MNYAHSSSSAAFSPPLFSLYFWVMRMELHEEGQIEGTHRAPHASGFRSCPASCAHSPGRAGLAGDTAPSRAPVTDCSNSFRGTAFLCPSLRCRSWFRSIQVPPR